MTCFDFCFENFREHLTENFYESFERVPCNCQGPKNKAQKIDTAQKLDLLKIKIKLK